MAEVALAEGSLLFEFTDVKFATKYDDWSHYRNKFNSACGSSKAVDFIVSKNSELWLIEVKDYRRYFRTKPSDLADEVMFKVRDTMAGLVSTKFVGADLDEVKRSTGALSQKKLRVILHIEQPAKPSRLFPRSVDPANLLWKMKQKLKFADAHPIVVDSHQFPARLGRVSSI